jgi:hypothetical protein
MAEVLDLQPGASVAAVGTVAPHEGASHPTPAAPKVQPAKGNPPPSAPPSSHQAAAAQPEAPPSGYVAHEPGAVAGPALTAAASPGTATAPASPHDAGNATGSLHTSTASMQPAGKAQPQAGKAASAPVKAQEATPVPQGQPLHEVAVGPGDVLAISPKLEAAPMAPPQQIQVLEMVTQMATLIRDQRTQIANLQVDVQTSQKATSAKLSDFERRLVLVEAGSALAAASGTPAPAAAVPGASSKPSGTTVALTSAKAALAAASATAAPPAAPAQPTSGTPEQYRVQAASPGLAMLAEVDRSGGDGAQQEVQVGDTLPGYGRVLSVSQRGTAWVVKTEHGTIQ